MKCICPMGGDRVCPDNCFIAAWHSLPPDQKTKERRRPVVEQLAKQGYTQEAIAMQLGVSQKTISNDIETLVTLTNVKGQGKDTRGRKKSTGRPKGSKKRERPHKSDVQVQEQAALLFLDEGLSRDQVCDRTGLGQHEVQLAVERERGRREAAPNITPEMLSMTAQQKFDAAIRQRTRKLEIEIEARIRAEHQRWLNEVSLPQYAKELAELERSITSRKGVMDRLTYRKILACLHPDRVQDPALKKRYEEAFRLFTGLEKRVLDEKESPTTFRKMPRTYEELMAMKAKVQAERRTKRATVVRR
jgi:transcriptional regulator with XRE-family HTH domain